MSVAPAHVRQATKPQSRYGERAVHVPVGIWVGRGLGPTLGAVVGALVGGKVGGTVGSTVHNRAQTRLCRVSKRGRLKDCMYCDSRKKAA